MACKCQLACWLVWKLNYNDFPGGPKQPIRGQTSVREIHSEISAGTVQKYKALTERTETQDSPINTCWILFYPFRKEIIQNKLYLWTLCTQALYNICLGSVRSDSGQQENCVSYLQVHTSDICICWGWYSNKSFQLECTLILDCSGLYYFIPGFCRQTEN